jgi:hypothetical protein
VVELADGIAALVGVVLGYVARALQHRWRERR